MTTAIKTYAEGVTELVREAIADGVTANATVVGDVRRELYYPADFTIIRKQITYNNLINLLTDLDYTLLFYSDNNANEEYRIVIQVPYANATYNIRIIVSDDTVENFENLVWFYTGSRAEIKRLQDLAKAQGFFSLGLEGLKSDSSTVVAAGEDEIYVELGESVMAPRLR